MENNNFSSNDFSAGINQETDLNAQPERAESAVATEQGEPIDNTVVNEAVTENPPADETVETAPKESGETEPTTAEYEYTAPENSESVSSAQAVNTNQNYSAGQGGYTVSGDTFGTGPAPVNNYKNAVHGYTLPKKYEDDPSNKRGMRVFALVLVAVIVAVSLLTGGYFLGKNSVGGNRNVVTPGLESKTEAEVADITEVYNNVIDSVVYIEAFNSTARSTASGVVYTSDGYIITNDHIYSEISSPQFYVTTNDGTRYEATYVAGDARSDLAVLKIDAKGLTTAVFGDSGELCVGEKVAAIGYPSTSLNVNPSLTTGIVSSLDARISTTTSYSAKVIQTDTAINPGSSGGVLVNMYSQVVGITSAKLVSEDTEGIGYAIPSASVKHIVDLLIKEGYVKGRAKLGITYTEIDSVYSSLTDMPTGLYVMSVSSDSSLAELNLKEGDIITHVNDKAIINSTVMLDVIESSSAGDEIYITVCDSETEQSATYTVTLVEDAGSSSYSMDDETAESDEGGEYSSGFDFPAGE